MKLTMPLGVQTLLDSSKGVLALLLIAVISVGLFLGKITGEAYVSALVVIAGVYSTSSAYVDATQLKNAAPSPDTSYTQTTTQTSTAPEVKAPNAD